MLAGGFDLDGDLPVNPDGGLKAFGHPIGASGLRMMFECWLQLRGEAPPERAVPGVAAGRTLALTHNLGGVPGSASPSSPWWAASRPPEQTSPGVRLRAPTAVGPHGRSSTYPSAPCTRIRCPSGISRVASTTPTTAGRPYSRAITAP